ncbi:MAG: hypothetical protein ABI230_10760 [Aestuariivirga sp.]
MRKQLIVAAALIALCANQATAQQAVDWNGKWLFSGLALNGRLATSFAQICDIQTTGSQISGPCHGPNGSCSLVGVVNGSLIDLTCSLDVINNPRLDGVLTFHGGLSPDGIVRGSTTHSGRRGTGQASMMKL